MYEFTLELITATCDPSGETNEDQPRVRMRLPLPSVRAITILPGRDSAAPLPNLEAVRLEVAGGAIPAPTPLDLPGEVEEPSALLAAEPADTAKTKRHDATQRSTTRRKHSPFRSRRRPSGPIHRVTIGTGFQDRFFSLAAMTSGQAMTSTRDGSSADAGTSVAQPSPFPIDAPGRVCVRKRDCPAKDKSRRCSFQRARLS